MFPRCSLDILSMFPRYSLDVPSIFPRLNSARSRSLIRQAAVVYLSSLVAIRADVYLLAMVENLAAEVLSFGTMPDVA